jgi:hypothetical protein
MSPAKKTRPTAPAPVKIPGTKSALPPGSPKKPPTLGKKLK